jgi:hypothetical protein
MLTVTVSEHLAFSETEAKVNFAEFMFCLVATIAELKERD